MLPQDVMHVIGVDTHRDTHTYAIVERATGLVVDEFQFPADGGGYRAALRRVPRTAGGRVWAIEGTGSYGAGLTDHLQTAGEIVFEVDHPHRRDPDRRGKSDPLDAIRAARMVIGRDRHSQPRERRGPREALRVLLIARRGAIQIRTDAIRQLRSLIIGLPDHTRQKLNGLTIHQLITACAKLRAPKNDLYAHSVTGSIRAIAKRCQAATDEADQHAHNIKQWVDDSCPQLLEIYGVGPISAAQLLVSWSHPGRLTNDACFARLAGVAPIPASSGNTTRHRLDRGGDRQLNNAIHTIALIRAQGDQETKQYIQRKIQEGKTRREALRALKRHIARRLYNTMETTSNTT